MTVGRAPRRCARVFGAVAAAAVLGLACLTTPAVASPGALRVLVVEPLTGSSTTCPEPKTLEGAIRGQAGVASVDFVDGSGPTPVAALLDTYDVVVVMSNCWFADPAAMGDRLADYQDRGGVVVGALFVWTVASSTSRYTLAGRWITGGYSPYAIGAAGGTQNTSLGPRDPANPLLDGVSSLSTKIEEGVSLTPGATPVASWTSGDFAVASKGDAVGINASLGDQAGNNFSGDFGRLIVNAGNVLGRHTLTVGRAGTGAGTVTSNPAGISCGGACAANYTNGTSVTLNATPAAGSAFDGWSGAGCSGTGACVVTMSAARAVTAGFSVVPPFAGLDVRFQTVTLGAHGKVKLSLACPATSQGRCVGTDVLTTAGKVTPPRIVAAAKKKKARVLTLGRGTFSIAPGKRGTVTITLNRTALKLLGRKRAVAARETIVAHDLRNVSKTSVGSVKLKVAGKKRKH